MEKKVIYVLKCPFTKEVHYVGKSINGMTRPISHLRKSHSLKIQEWVYELSILGYKPEVEIVLYLSEIEDLDNAERMIIQRYLANGCILLNSSLVKPLTIIPNLDASDYKGIDNISIFLKEKRKSVNLTQEELSEKSGVALTVVRKLEQGKTNVNLDGLITLLSMFGCKIDISKIKA
jgi:DNA-binding XRE family transcriptional regulator